jgi:hypothetical protein
MPIVIPKLSFPFKIPLTHYPIYISLYKFKERACAPSQASSICPFYYYLFMILNSFVVALAYYQGKDIVFRFIIEYYSSFRDFGPEVIIIIGLFLDEDF